MTFEPRMDTGGISPRINGAMRQDGEGAPELVVASSRPIPFGLTPFMANVKALIAACGDGPSPSYQQMADQLGVASKSNISRAVEMLIERNHVIRFGIGRARSLRVIQHSCPHCGGDLSAAPLHPGSENGEVP